MTIAQCREDGLTIIPKHSTYAHTNTLIGFRLKPFSQSNRISRDWHRGNAINFAKPYILSLVEFCKVFESYEPALRESGTTG